VGPERLQALSKDGKAVSIWPDHDTAFLDIARGLRRTVDTWRSAVDKHVKPHH
jgi:hypothetical protein